VSQPFRSPADLGPLAEAVGSDWRSTRYYDAAEHDIDARWASLIWPFIHGCDFAVCVDLAAGHGRNTRKLLELPACGKVYLVDINQENIDFCSARFNNEPRVACIRNSGFEIEAVESASVTLVYSFDSMVHFDSDVVRSYLGEIGRILRPGGHAFLHHSNYIGNPGGDVHQNPHWRNFMSAELMVHYAAKEGLGTIRQQKLDWNHDGSYIDCLSLLRLPI
jgi:SAM-dependent methyltransferase